MTGDDIVKEKGVYDALSIDKFYKKLEEMAEIAMGHPYAMWPSVLALAVLVLTCIICVVRRRNFKKPTKTYVYKPLLDQEGTRFKMSGLPGDPYMRTTYESECFSFENANKAEESEDEEEIYSRSNVA